MLSLLKKNPDSSIGLSTRPWHPNFRNFASLPDTKIIRTTFFVNLILGLCVAALILLSGSQEYQIHELDSQLREVDAQILKDKKASEDGIALYAKFQAEEKKIQGVEVFLKNNKILLSALIHRLGETIPSGISISALEYGDLSVNLRGLAIGAPEQASGMVSAYEKQLKADGDIGKFFESIALTNLSRDSENGRLSFEILFRSPSAAKSGKKS